MIFHWIKTGLRSLIGQERIDGVRYWSKCVGKKVNLLSRGIQYIPILSYIEIDGFLSVNEATILYDLARELPSPAPVVVEIGSWQGKSTFILAKGIHGRKEPILYCIDPFDGAGDPVSLAGYSIRKTRLQTSLREKFDQNMEKYKVSPILKVFQGYSHDFVSGFREKIDFLFIDGNHEYQSVLQDFQDWSPLVKVGGWVAFHDVVRKESVRGPLRVVEQELINKPQWKLFCWTDSLYIVQKQG